MRQVFCIRENKTDTWCVSSKHASFYQSFNDAAIFLSESNAKSAIRDMLRRLDPKKGTFPAWAVEGECYISQTEGNKLVYQVLVPDFEVVPFDLTEVR